MGWVETCNVKQGRTHSLRQARRSAAHQVAKPEPRTLRSALRTAVTARRSPSSRLCADCELRSRRWLGVDVRGNLRSGEVRVPARRATME